MNIPSPTSLERRELAFLLFREHLMVRHKSVRSIGNLRLLLGEVAPSDVYRSCAYYENPEAEMDKKGWLGADLVFDIDADHIPTKCDKLHDEWTCFKCKSSGKGSAPVVCSNCGGKKLGVKTWPCDSCLGSAKNETLKLIDFLENDFGFSRDEIHVFFSGHRGYHVQIENDIIQTLDSLARKEIVDYISGLGLSILSNSSRGRGSADFNLHDFGWNRRLKNSLAHFLSDATEEQLKEAGIKTNYAAIILQEKEAIQIRCLAKGRWDSIKGLSIETWKKLIGYIRDLESPKIDTVVTTDIHRLIRLNGSLHGKTGLKKVEFDGNKLASFDPFTEAVAFKKGTMKVYVTNVPQFHIGGNLLGPYKDEKVELPMAAAILLICRDRAEVVE